jgi:hypothetical protein
LIKIKVICIRDWVDILSIAMPIAATAQQDCITHGQYSTSYHQNGALHHLIVVNPPMQLMFQQQRPSLAH